ncbi:MAG: hypothetical protein R6V45_07025 [Oceanipulchritudo sp.]
MEINPNRPVQKITRSKPAKGAAATPGTVSSQSSPSDSLSGVSFTRIEDQLLELPEVRQERVEDGRRLARDPNYPDPDQLRQISRFLADEGRDPRKE